MRKLTRRAASLLAGSAALPRFAIAQADARPSITIAVQRIANSNTFDNLREHSNVGERTAMMFNERLIEIDWRGTLAPKPGLAVAWHRPDDRTVELKLREGVVFHNGDAFTAEDVAARFSAQGMFGDTRPVVDGKTLAHGFTGLTGQASKDLPKEIPPVARRLWPGLDRVEVVDRHTVRFHNATPDVTLEGRMAALGSEVVSRRAYAEAPTWLEYARKPIGTGPYAIREFKPDSLLTLDAHDAYWGGRPPVKSIRLVEVPEASSRINGLLAGEYHFACDIAPDQIATIARNPAFEVLGGTILNHRLTSFDKFHPQLADPRVRLAMAHAVDRQTIVDALWGGRTRVPKGLQWEFFGDMFISEWNTPAYDPARARQLLRDAGYKGDPIPYRLLNNYYVNQVPTSQVLVEMWKQVGVNVAIEMKETFVQLRDRSQPRGVRDWSSGATLSDPIGSMVSNFGPNGAAQQAREYANEEFTRLSVILETSADRPLRRRAFARMLEIAERDDPAYIMLHQAATFTAKRRDIKWKAMPAFQMDFSPGNFAL